MIKAVIFDIDGVLLDSFEANHKFLRDIGDFMKMKVPNKSEFRKRFH